MSQQFYISFDGHGRATGSGATPDGTIPSGCIECTEEQAQAWQGCTLSGSMIVEAPEAETAARRLVASAQAALRAGLNIKSANTPSIDGIYAVDTISQMDIISIETSLNAGKGFPGGGQAFNFPDASGAMHAFSEANFTNFAAAVRDYVYALKSCIGGSLSELPSAIITID